MNNKKMKTHNNDKLIEILKKKNIRFNVEKNFENALFKKYSYYQVINAYKNLFITDIEFIDDIKNNIFSNNEESVERYRKEFEISTYGSDDEFFEKVCSSICDKYGLKAENSDEKLKIINKIEFHQHVYANGPLYRDFIRMYKFEHELRLMLLKYVLIIEESIKNIFISYLNNNNKSADYLVNMENYNTSSINNKAIDTIQLIVKKYNNMNSRPVKKKRDQDLTIPYWILINELAMNETYNTILNLNLQDSTCIFAELTSFFTRVNINVTKNDNDIIISDKDKSLIETFKSILSYLGKFRNMLAHNQPIYIYNIESYNINSDIKFKYEMPSVKYKRIEKEFNDLKSKDIEAKRSDDTIVINDDKKYKDIARVNQQYRLNGNLMRDLVVFFGLDNYNKRNQEINLDLSFIIYIISKILNQIDKNNNFYDEITSIYSKYSIILIDNKIELNSIELLEKHLDCIDNLTMEKFDIEELIKKIDNGEAYVRKLKHAINEYESAINQIRTSRKKINIVNVDSKYKPFKEYKRYMEFTGINKQFFSILKR